jgi:cysteine desulfurase
VARVRDAEVKRIKSLQRELSQLLAAKVPSAVVNGDTDNSLPHILNISIPDIQSEYVTLRLDHEGFAISTKSACREGEERESHVVKALGGPEWRAQNTLRISLGEHTKPRDISRFVDALARSLSR